MKCNRKQIKSISQVEYLNLCKIDLNKEDYIKLEKIRKGSDWTRIIIQQNFKCYYCNTEIQKIQKLIFSQIIGLRKRGKSGYSGLHFELDHKNANKKDNSTQNLVAACYYCNNDKSNTISDMIFLNYFGPQRKIAFENMILDNKLECDDLFIHHLFKKINCLSI
jgi:hypothetical protein